MLTLFRAELRGAIAIVLGVGVKNGKNKVLVISRHHLKQQRLLKCSLEFDNVNRRGLDSVARNCMARAAGTAGLTPPGIQHGVIPSGMHL